MEQQTVSVAKAGLISTLNARTSVCACANPIGSRYNNSLSLSENINLPPTLLTRFDLIYLVLDKCEEERDRRLARHLVSLFHENPEAQRADEEDIKIPKDLLKEYISYARNRIQPKLNDSAIEELVSAYR
jgi:DNA replication licensing factor MCM4